MSTLDIHNVYKAYGSVEVLHGVSLNIKDGEFVALVGPSGCGKSTLLRMIAGLEDITAGDIVIGDRIVNDVAPKNRNVAMVFQNYALYPHMNVRDNMGFPLRQRRMPKAEIERRVNDAARILGLEPLLERKPRALSGGQRQRVAMGRAIVREPNVFLFDEPLSNLDAKLRVQMRSEIKELHQRLGITTVYVTHDQIEAMTLADRVVVMNGGIIEQEGPPLELYDKPASRFVAAFIGSPPMNFLEGEIADGAVLVLADGTRLQLPAGRQYRRAHVTVGVRPEHFELHETGWPATVSVIEPTGSETQITARMAGQIVRILVRGRTLVMPGEVIHLQVRSELLHIFEDEVARGSRVLHLQEKQYA
ncbi:multiple sugar transport system ATP-binding protein [Microvirga lupini]|uniref:Multiple sugar transport system ATP-binding protein n=1 Tax=Microvirga lupini TaxID=420324 RepID=A0A7W4VL03_9HYPH|nr:sn-glycerol-3-phosphate ABC transporter ATP-binding protein UgpC [Microvirga lupini]MBB3019134.1 multiple sugar transport system ATP-binding protein [Microvirga lupini]